jgi:hypothetical protein
MNDVINAWKCAINQRDFMRIKDHDYAKTLSRGNEEISCYG